MRIRLSIKPNPLKTKQNYIRKVTIYFLFHKYTITFFSKSPLKESHRQVKLKTKHEVLFGQATIKKKLQQG